MRAISTQSVSVVIPAYNSARFIVDALGSIFNQLHLPDEVIVVDDASTDGTPQLVQAEARHAPIPVRMITRRWNNGGPARPMNQGIQAARSNLIALLDHDDLMRPENLAAKLALLERHPELEQVFGDYKYFGDDELELNRGLVTLRREQRSLMGSAADSTWILSPLDAMRIFVHLPWIVGGCGNMFFRKTLWQRIGGFAPRYGACADYDFNLRSLVGPVGWIGQETYQKRMHGENLWIANHANQLQTLRSQAAGLARFPELRDLRSDVIERICAFARQRRWEGLPIVSLWAGWELIRMRAYRAGFREITKTLLAVPRDARMTWLKRTV